MEKKNITDFTDIYATYMRIKDGGTRQDYIVLRDGKDKGGQYGKDRKLFN